MAAHRALDGVAGAFPLIDWFMNTNYDRNMYTEEASVVTMRWLLLTHLLLPPFVLSSRRWLAWPSAIALIASAAYLMHARSVHLMIYTHYVPGLMMLAIAQGVLRGGGGVVVPDSVVKPAAVVVVAAISEYQAIRVYRDVFHSLSHCLLHILYGAWALVMVADHAVARWRPHKLAHFRAARLIHDPMLILAVGILLIAHQHDLLPIAEFFHDFWGATFCIGAAFQFVSGVTHGVLPRSSAVCAALRCLCSFVWTLQGLWAMLMGFWLNVWGDNAAWTFSSGSGRWTGLREIIFNDDSSKALIGQKKPTGYEEGMHLLGYTIWAAALLTAYHLHNDAETSRALLGEAPPPPPKVDEDESLLAAEEGSEVAMGALNGDHLSSPRATLDDKMSATICQMTKNGHMNGHH